MLKRGGIFFAVALFFLTVVLYGCKVSENTDVDPVAAPAKDVPIILYTADSTKELRDVTTAVKIEYDIAGKKLEGEPADVFSFNNGYYENYQWSKENEMLFSSGAKIVSVSADFVVRKDIGNEPLTKIYEIGGTVYKVYGNEQGIVLQHDSGGGENQVVNINLADKNRKYRDFAPMTLFKKGKDLIILVHYHRPVEDGGMASGLYQVKLAGGKTKIDGVDLKGQCCINDEIEPVVIGDRIYVNTNGNLGYVSVSKKFFSAVPYFDTLKKQAEADLKLVQADTPDSLRTQPAIGKIGDLLLLSYGGKSADYIWGVRDDKVVFKISAANNNIFDDSGNRIGTVKLGIERVLLPNW